MISYIETGHVHKVVVHIEGNYRTYYFPCCGFYRHLYKPKIKEGRSTES